MQETIEQLIAKGQTKKAIQVLIKSKKNYFLALLLSNQYSRLERRIIMGVIREEEANIQLATLNSRILLLNQSKSSNILLYTIPLIVLIISLLSINFFLDSKEVLVTGKVKINNTFYKGVQIVYLKNKEIALTDTRGEFKLKTKKFDVTEIQIKFDSVIDTIISIKTTNPQISFSTQKGYVETHIKKDTINVNSNKIINSEKSVIQTGDNNRVSFD